MTTVIQPPPAPAAQWPPQSQGHPFGEPPCWADPLSRDERAELARFMDAWRLYASAAADTVIITRVLGIGQPAALRLSLSLRRACAELADLTIDVTERAQEAAA
jgi:hypothetical protein